MGCGCVVAKYGHGSLDGSSSVNGAVRQQSCSREASSPPCVKSAFSPRQQQQFIAAASHKMPSGDKAHSPPLPDARISSLQQAGNVEDDLTSEGSFVFEDEDDSDNPADSEIDYLDLGHIMPKFCPRMSKNRHTSIVDGASGSENAQCSLDRGSPPSDSPEASPRKKLVCSKTGLSSSLLDMLPNHVSPD